MMAALKRVCIEAKTLKKFSAARLISLSSLFEPSGPHQDTMKKERPAASASETCHLTTLSFKLL
jgi:hypothetical protein